MKKPEKLTLSSVYDKMKVQPRINEHLYFHEGFAMANNLSNVLRLIAFPSTPYLIEDYRIGFVRRGFVHGIINLEETLITPGCIVFVKPGTITEPIEISNDAQIKGIGLTADMFQLIHAEHVPTLFRGINKHGVMKVDEKRLELVDALFSVLWKTLNTPDIDAVVAGSITRSVTTLYNDIFNSQQSARPNSTSAHRIYEQFINLVNIHCQKQHNLSFYAGQLCITERYLGTVIHQTSGVTAKEWIDRALITVAKVALRHTDKQIAQIAYELNFSNPSFFCKYFKHHTGCTPEQYRKGTKYMNNDRK